MYLAETKLLYWHFWGIFRHRYYLGRRRHSLLSNPCCLMYPIKRTKTKLWLSKLGETVKSRQTTLMITFIWISLQNWIPRNPTKTSRTVLLLFGKRLLTVTAREKKPFKEKLDRVVDNKWKRFDYQSWMRNCILKYSPKILDIKRFAKIARHFSDIVQSIDQNYYFSL